jgi:hypothetical protein
MHGLDQQVFRLFGKAGDAEQKLFCVAVVALGSGMVQGFPQVGGKAVRANGSDYRTCQSDQFPVSACLSKPLGTLNRSTDFSTFGLLLSSRTL